MPATTVENIKRAASELRESLMRATKDSLSIKSKYSFFFPHFFFFFLPSTDRGKNALEKLFCFSSRLSRTE